MSMSHPINPSVSRLARLGSAALLAITALTSTMAGQTAAPSGPAPTPCVNDRERHNFDFWIGEWDVTTKGGSPAGHSVIQSVSGGCALLENWTGLNGGNGKSLNAYNPLIRQWQQFWIGQDGGVTEFRSSELDGASLVFFVKDDANKSAISRLRFTPVDSATVRQHSESTKDGGKTWKTHYDLYYHRKAQ